MLLHAVHKISKSFTSASTMFMVLNDFQRFPNMFFKYPHILIREYQFNQVFTKIITLILLHQNLNGHATIVLPEIFNTISVELIYLLSLYYKHITFSIKISSELSCGMCNQTIITCKLFKGIELSDLLKLQKINKEWSYIDHSNGLALNLTKNMIRSCKKYNHPCIIFYMIR